MYYSPEGGSSNRGYMKEVKEDKRGWSAIIYDCKDKERFVRDVLYQETGFIVTWGERDDTSEEWF